MYGSEKYEFYVAVLTGQATQREAAGAVRVDRSTVIHLCRTANRGEEMSLGDVPSPSRVILDEYRILARRERYHFLVLPTIRAFAFDGDEARPALRQR